MVKKNTCIFISGNGTNLNALIKSSRSYNFPIKIKLIISNKHTAKGLLIAKKYSIPYIVRDMNNFINEIKILRLIKNYNISLICLAGYMKILPNRFIKIFKNPIVNIHPSLLPKFKGLNTFSNVLKNNEKKTGCSVHFVNEKLDSGKIILKKFFWIKKKDTQESLKRKTQKLEYRAYSEAIIKISQRSIY